MDDEADGPEADGPEADGPELVQAAGGVVWRHGRVEVEVLVIHRPRYGDWSLPKGKLDAGETHEAAALREVEEETGVRGELGPDLGEVRYTDGRGRSKVVRWWAVRALHTGERTDVAEVDELRWLSVGRAAALVTQASDADVLERFRATVRG